MVVFLTSSPTGPLDGSRRVEGLDRMNHFRENLGKYWKPESRCLMISAFPHLPDNNDEMRGFFEDAVVRSGFSVSGFDLWDDRIEKMSKEDLHSYDVIFLGGGHVPTQMAFFERIGLREKMRDYRGIVIGISAGSMNSADVVYIQPEEEGESSSEFRRFGCGLDLTKTQVLPHYQMVKDRYLDGRRLYEDLTYADSWGHEFLVLVDGSYLLIENGYESVWGEAYVIHDGRIEAFCRENESCRYR